MNSLNFFFEPILWTGMLYLVYHITIKQTTLYRLSRIVLLFILVSGIIIPFIRFSIISQNESIPFLIPDIIINGASIDSDTSGTNHIFADQLNPVRYFYYLILIGLIITFIIKIISVFQLINSNKNNQELSYKIRTLKGEGKVFTFINKVYMSEDISEKELIFHEMAHVQQKHFIDKLIAHIVTTIQWFNPFAWIIKKELDSIHEYQADAIVLDNEFTELNTYKKLLIEKSLGNLNIMLASNFNQSLIKKRIEMMKKQKSSILSGLKVLTIIPVMVGLIFFMACENAPSENTETKIYTEVDQMAQYPGGIQALQSHIAQNIRYPQIAKDSGTSGKIFVQFVVDAEGVVRDTKIIESRIEGPNEVVVVAYGEKNAEISEEALKALDDEAIRVINSLKQFTPAKKDGETVATQFTVPIVFMLE